MTKPRTLEEITYDAWVAVHTPGNVSRVFAVLREAADAAYESGLKLGTAQQAEAVEEARREEREALRLRLMKDVEHWKAESQKGSVSWSSNCDGAVHEARNILAWLDARSRAEEPK